MYIFIIYVNAYIYNYIYFVIYIIAYVPLNDQSHTMHTCRVPKYGLARTWLKGLTFSDVDVAITQGTLYLSLF